MIRSFIRKYSSEILIGFLFFFTYTPTFLWMWDRWFVRDSYYSHGILIPFISVFFIWNIRADLARIQPKSSPWGLRLVVLGLIVHILSSLLRIYFSSGLSMLVVLSGIVLHFYGTRIYRKILFPILFLIFMIPAPLVLITNISFRMKIFAAEIAQTVLSQMGFLAVRDGSVIRMQHAYVVVDDICSGLRSLISLTALGAIFAFWMKTTPLKKTLLFISTIPIAVLTNVCRIVFLSIISEVWGPKYATGFIHDLSGYLIFALAYIFLFMVWRMLE